MSSIQKLWERHSSDDLVPMFLLWNQGQTKVKVTSLNVMLQAMAAVTGSAFMDRRSTSQAADVICTGALGAALLG